MATIRLLFAAKQQSEYERPLLPVKQSHYRIRPIQVLILMPAARARCLAKRPAKPGSAAVSIKGR
jgi:hypothetical protein